MSVACNTRQQLAIRDYRLTASHHAWFVADETRAVDVLLCYRNVTDCPSTEPANSAHCKEFITTV